MNHTTRKSTDIGRCIDKLAQKLTSNALKKSKRPSWATHSLHDKLNTLEDKVAASPYAAMLASPLRLCMYHRRMFPSRMLLRFGMVQDKYKNKLYPLPEVGRTKPSGPNGIKRYVRLRRPIFDELSQKGSKLIFLGKAEFQKDTMEIIHHEIALYAQNHYKNNNNYLKELSRLENDLWQSSSNEITYQCILISSTDEKTPFYQHHRIINPQGKLSTLPCYNIARIGENLDKEGYGVVKSASTVELAIALYRYGAFFS
ncbi:hypothetical protein BDA99DRAFT_566636 [Phascolomyces articulosus]|uniref:Uncharacterized protein n=1 Tax=Phascolomyces articulosus TaxID=60185 RepID=A0AAD5JW09_9FUNG|nr:hypothetical protein BDA99DRAFT_566636 [Phascolomyces articulosus]